MAKPVETWHSKLSTLFYGRDTHRVFCDFATICACCLSLEQREEEYLQTIKPYKKEDLHIFAAAFALLIEEMEKKPVSRHLRRLVHRKRSESLHKGRSG